MHRKPLIVFVCIFIIVFAVFLRFYGIGSQPLWTDEANCLAIAQGESGPVWEALQKDCSPPLYYWLLGASVWYTEKPSEGETRILSAIFGVLCIPIIMWMGYELLGLAGLWGGMFAAFSPLLIWHSQEARMYSFIVLLGACLIYVTLRIIDDPDRTSLFLSLVFFQLLLLWTHHFSLFPVVISWIMIFAGTRIPLRIVRPYILILIAGWLPVGWLAAIQSFAYRTGDWLPPPPADAVFRSVGLWVCGIEAMEHSIIARIPVTLVLGAVGIALPAANGLRDVVGRRCAIFALGGLILSFAVSLIRPAYTPGRYDVCFLPAFLIFLSAGMRRSPRLIRAIACVALVAAGLLGIRHYYTSYEKSAVKDLTGIISERAHEHDAIVVVPEIEVPVVRYYYAGPCEIIVPPSFTDVRTVDYRDYARRWSDPANARTLALRTVRKIPPGGRIFLIYSPYKTTVEYKGWLMRTTEHVERIESAVTGSGYTELVLIG